jgi:hypothetical protein
VVGVGELLAEADGLADGEVFGDDVGLTDLVGFTLRAGLRDVGGWYLTATLGEGVGLACGLARCVAEGAADELMCCAVLLPTSPLARPMCPVR